jgi:2-polyprenyl-6-hydroxyphenyl methylase/3-demethylubiquinone-9 3-methyltransferase
MNELESVTEHFNRAAQTFVSNYSNSPDFKERLTVWRRATEKHIADMPSGSLCLDMGCGDGSIGRQVAIRGIRTIGFDQSETMLALARQRAAESDIASQTEYVRASLPLAKELAESYRDAAGLIICSSVLEYVSDYEEALRQFYSLLKPGGVLLLSLPNRLSLYRVLERTLLRHLASEDSYLRHQRHQFDSQKISKLVALIGFRKIGVEFFALPLQAVTEKIVGAHRGRRLATMFMVTARKL